MTVTFLAAVPSIESSPLAPLALVLRSGPVAKCWQSPPSRIRAASSPEKFRPVVENIRPPVMFALASAGAHAAEPTA